MSGLLVLHLLAVGVWIGVVGAEFFIEFDGMSDDASHVRAAKMHFATDIWIEIPAFTIVLVTGVLMLGPGPLEGMLFYKVLFGVLAVLFNLVCVYAVFRRRRFALTNDVAGMNSTNVAMRLGGAGFIPAFLVALVLAAFLVLL